MKKLVVAFAAGALIIASCGQGSQKNNEGTTASATDGKQLFMENCASCHSPTEDRTGPALAGALGRWGNDTAKLVAFIKNPMAVINAGGKDSYPGQLFDKWHHIPMTAFPNLSDEEIKQIINGLMR